MLKTFYDGVNNPATSWSEIDIRLKIKYQMNQVHGRDKFEKKI